MAGRGAGGRAEEAREGAAPRAPDDPPAGFVPSYGPGLSPRDLSPEARRDAWRRLPDHLRAELIQRTKAEEQERAGADLRKSRWQRGFIAVGAIAYAFFGLGVGPAFAVLVALAGAGAFYLIYRLRADRILALAISVGGFGAPAVVAAIATGSAGPVLVLFPASLALALVGLFAGVRFETSLPGDNPWDDSRMPSFEEISNRPPPRATLGDAGRADADRAPEAERREES